MSTAVILVLLVTVPVALGIGLSGWAASRAGQLGLWSALLLTCVCAVLFWGAGWEGPIGQRFLAPVSLYAPALILGGIGLSLLGSNRWRVLPVMLLAVVVALANIFLAQHFFVIGCSAQFWVCP